MKAYTLPVLVCIPDDKRKKDKLEIEKSAQPEWMPEYEKHIKDKKPSIPIKIHPLLMCDKDTAIAEYDRLYEILKEPYVRVYASNQSKEEADRFIKSIIDEYIGLWTDVREYNDIETRSMLADDSKKLKHYANVVKSAERIDIELDEDERINKIYVKDINNHRVCLQREHDSCKEMINGINDILFNDIATNVNTFIRSDGLTDIIIKKTNKNWDAIRKIIEDSLRRRIFFETDIRSLTGEMALKCKSLYTFIAEHRKAFNLNNKKYAYDVGDWVKKILSLNIDAIKMVEKIQGKY
jgi:hypothetical protein